MLAAPPPSPAPRARDLGIPFDFGSPGPHNAITDVPGVEVGHVTLIEGDSVRTGVTAVLPRGRGDDGQQPCFAGHYSLNGNGEMTGIAWHEEAGVLEGPVLITNTNAVGVLRDAVIQYAHQRCAPRGLVRRALVAAWSRRRGTAPSRHLRRARQGRARASGDRAARPGPVAEARWAAARVIC